MIFLCHATPNDVVSAAKAGWAAMPCISVTVDLSGRRPGGQAASNSGV